MNIYILENNRVKKETSLTLIFLISGANTLTTFEQVL